MSAKLTGFGKDRSKDTNLDQKNPGFPSHFRKQTGFDKDKKEDSYRDPDQNNPRIL